MSDKSNGVETKRENKGLTIPHTVDPVAAEVDIEHQNLGFEEGL